MMIFIFCLIQTVFAQLTTESLYDELRLKSFQSAYTPGEFLFEDFRLNRPSLNFSSCEEKSKNQKSELKLIFLAEMSVASNQAQENKRLSSSVSALNFKPEAAIYQAFNLQTTSQMSAQDFSAAVQGIGSYLYNNPNEMSHREEQIRIAAQMLILGAAQQYDANQTNDYDQEKELESWMMTRIKDLNLTEDESLILISQISDTFYDNYNNPRNFTEAADNENRFFSRMAYGSMNGINNDGGVCDDIAAMGCDLYQKINPRKDCLTAAYAGAGTYHVVMMTGQGTGDYTILDGGSLTKVDDAQFLKADMGKALSGTGTFIRLSKVENGKARDIYLQKNEYGEWIERLTMNDAPGAQLTSQLDPALIRQVSLKIEQDVERGKKEVQKNIGVAEGELSDGSQIVAVYAKIDLDRNGWRSGISTAATFQRYPSYEGISSDLFRIHLQPYVQKTKILFQDEQLSIQGSAYIRGSLMFGYGYKKTDDNVIPGVSGDGHLMTGLNSTLNYQNHRGLSAQLRAQQSLSLGSKNYSGMHAFHTSDEFQKMLSQVKFSMQNTELDLNLKQKLKKDQALLLQAGYRGTNVGQLWNVQGGFSVHAPEGVEIYVLAGYTGGGKGFQTQGNFLHQPVSQGINSSVGLKTSKGVEVSGQVSIDPKSHQDQARLRVLVPIQGKKKKPKIP